MVKWIFRPGNGRLYHTRTPTPRDTSSYSCSEVWPAGAKLQTQQTCQKTSEPGLGTATDKAGKYEQAGHGAWQSLGPRGAMGWELRSAGGIGFLPAGSARPTKLSRSLQVPRRSHAAPQLCNAPVTQSREPPINRYCAVLLRSAAAIIVEDGHSSRSAKCRHGATVQWCCTDEQGGASQAEP